METKQTKWEELSISNDFLEAVKEAKKNREWRHEYMTLLMRDQENVKIGEEKMLLLYRKADKR